MWVLLHRHLQILLIHALRQVKILWGESVLTVMSGEYHMYGMVDIGPFRMMPKSFGVRRYAQHEAQGSQEIIKQVRLCQCFATVVLFPLPGHVQALIQGVELSPTLVRRQG
jgi:hypothetical protein